MNNSSLLKRGNSKSALGNMRNYNYKPSDPVSDLLT
jgi:hypothetical protein